MEYYVTYNGTIVFNGNINEVDNFLNSKLLSLGCPVFYEKLDEYITTENYYYIEKVEGIPVKDYICGNIGITEEQYEELVNWLNSGSYKEFEKYEINCEPF